MDEHPVRLVLVDLSHGAGLAERSLWELSMRLPRERYSVHVWLSADDGADGLADAFAARDIGVERFEEPGARWDWKTPLHLWLELRRKRPQLVHVHHAGHRGSLRVARSAAADGVPVLITRHDCGTLESDPETRKVYAGADAITTATRADAEELVRAWGVRRERVRWIPYGAEAPDDEAENAPARAWRQHLGARPLRPLWVCPLRLDRRRGHEVLLEALAEVRRRQLDFVFAFTGDGPMRADLERRSEALGLADSVRFIAAYDAPGPALAAADAVLFPVLEGPMPLTLLDAMARARPVVASAVGAIADVIEDGVHGRCVPPGDVTALADALDAFHRRPDAAIRLGRAAVTLVREAFTWDRVVDAYEDAYDEILGLASFVPEPAEPATR